jgi:hypothetical protein
MNKKAYNFRIHMGAAERVFECLQDFVPFSFLGKFAAYEVGVTRQELEAVDRATVNSECCDASRKKKSELANASSSSSSMKGGGEASQARSFLKQNSQGLPTTPTTTTTTTTDSWHLPCLSTMAREQMNKFRHGNYELWCKLYPVPPKFNNLNSMEW